VLGKLAAFVLGFVILFAAAVRLSGAPLIPRGQEAAGSDSVDSIDPEAERLEWIDHVSAICDYERKRGRTLNRVYREGALAIPKDVELWLLSVIRMGDESRAMFNRLTPPLEYRREVRELRGHFRKERLALEGLVDAVRNGDAREYIRRWRDLTTADARKVEALRNLGLKKCVPRLPEPEPGERKPNIV
jgi:hypothetical protein